MRNEPTARLALSAALVTLAGIQSASAEDPELKLLRLEVERLIATSQAEVSVAMRTVGGKRELLIRPDVSYHAASTMKVPVMMELFAQARKGKLRLDDPLPVKNVFASIVDGTPYSLDPSDDSEGETYKAVGGTLSLRQLCEAMITRSGNLAANLLIEKLGVENIRRTVHDLEADGMQLLRGVEDAKAFQNGLNNTTTARALMVLLHRLARGRVVDAASSREMVLILARQRFKAAIPAGLPPGTPVAHKTGTITRIHHDAAIVYGPHPFVLVVLVRGLEDEKKSAALIADIARAVYAAVTAPHDGHAPAGHGSVTGPALVRRRGPAQPSGFFTSSSMRSVDSRSQASPSFGWKPPLSQRRGARAAAGSPPART